MTKQRRVEMNFWAMINSVLIHSMNKGQLPAAAIAIILIVLALRCPADQIPIILQHIWGALKSAAGVSYTINVVVIIGAAVGFKSMRKRVSDELDRIGQEKTNLQEQLAGRRLSSSNKGKTS